MGILTTLYLATLVGSAGVSVLLGVKTFRKRSETGMWWFTGLVASILLWSLGQAVETLASGYGQSLVGHHLKYVGVVGSATCFFLFALEYAGHDEYVTPRRVAALATYPVGISVAVFTNPIHGLLWPETSYAPEAISTFSNPGPGALFWVHIVVSYGLFLTGSVLLARVYYRSQSLYRGQIVATLVAVFVPWVVNAVYVFDLVVYDLTPTAFLVAGIAILSAMRWFEFSELTPIARNTVVDTMQAGVFVLDDEERLRDVNPAGQEMVGDAGSLVGRSARDVFGSIPGLYDCYADLGDGTDEVTVDAGNEIKRYRIEATPLSDDGGEDPGRVVVLQDVTDRFERERELQRQNEQLEQFASLVSHDLRNPLSVADGYVELIREHADDPEIEEYAEEVGRSHDRIERIIEDVLTMARQGQTIDETEPVDIGDLARRAWSNVDTRNASLDVEFSTVVEGDADRLLHVFENLFRNAVEHGGPDVTIRVGPISRPAFENGDGVGSGFFVEDDGPGIPEGRRETVFEAGHTTNEGGTGLGLAIVDQFVEAHGWSIEATESPAGGARFEVTGVPGVDTPGEPKIRGISD